MLNNWGKPFFLIPIGGIGIAAGSYGLINYFSKGELAFHVQKTSSQEICNVLTRNDRDSWEELSSEKCSELTKKIVKVTPENNKNFYWVSSYNPKYLKNALYWTGLIRKNDLKNGNIPQQWFNGPATCEKQESSNKNISVVCKVDEEKSQRQKS